MPTSGVTAFSNTARDIVTQSLRLAQILPSGDVPTADEMTDMIFAMNAKLKTWQATRGVNLWRETTEAVVILAGAASTILPADIRDVVSARSVISATYHRPLGDLTREEYMQIPNKVTPGTPACFYASRQRDAVTLFVWPVPIVDTTLSLEVDRIVETVTNETQTVDIPEDLVGTLVACLALEACTIFGSPIPPELGNRAVRLEVAMFDADRPKSYILGAA